MRRTLQRPRRPWLRWVLALLLLAWLASAAYHLLKPMPEGLSQAHPLRTAQDLAWLTDVTWVDAEGKGHAEQQVFDEILRLVAQAERLVVLDMFLFNDFAGAQAQAPLRALSSELTAALLARKRQVPALQVVVITDPINEAYGSLPSPHLRALEVGGVHVVVTDLAALRAPNPAWTGLWQLCCRWAGNSEGAGWLPSPFGEGEVTLRSYLALLNLNANHRKTLVVDSGEGWTGLVTSANPHDGSSAHGNIALRFSGDAALDLLQSERAVAELSGAGVVLPPVPAAPPEQASEDAGVRLQVLTEGGVRDALLHAIDTADAGDRLDLAVFYLAHRGVLEALVAARGRGAAVRVLLDPNRDAFGRTKNGIPNRQAALELHEAGASVRWCDTHGEQCHAKLLLKRGRDGTDELLAGSANFTRRNLDDYNLETSVRVLARGEAVSITQAQRYFDQAWHNLDGRQLSVPYAAFEDRSKLRYWRYRVAEATGLSSF